MAAGKKKPVLVVDDATRPTPVAKIAPFILEEFEAAGVNPTQIRVIVATGTHGPPEEKALAAKLGPRIMENCRVLVHNDCKSTKFVGKTSFDTPVYVNRELLDADLIVGVGGVYPQHSTGFGGGGKLALGVLGRRSIRFLHFGHGSVGGNYNTDNNFRRDVTEIARIIGLRSIVTVHINAYMEIVNVMAGDYTAYYDEAVEFSMNRYQAPAPDDADVVIANGYPSDVSYTFMRKGNKPILMAPADATKVMVASNHGGLGHHGLYPQGKGPRWLKYKEMWDRVSIMKPTVIASKILKKLFSRQKSTYIYDAESTTPPRDATLWIYTPEGGCRELPPLTGVKIVEEWDGILDIIRRSHPAKECVRVRIYPCASLQCLRSSPVEKSLEKDS
jgi:nickel-dependent lactate racemase